MSKSPDVPVPNVWIWNIDSNKQKFFAAELKAGRLRQGWGDDDRLDLRLIKKKTEQKQPLDEEESAAWNRLNVMIMDWGIKLTDIILVKNTPKWGWYTLAKVIGGYQFDRKAKDSNGDYGHFLNVDPVWEVEKHSAPVAGDLRSSIDNARWPITAAVKRAPEILKLLQATPEELKKPIRLRERLSSQSMGLLALAKKQIETLSPSEFEQSVKDLLDVERFENVTLTAGAGEHGADVVMSVSAPFFEDLNIVVQIKHYRGEANDTRAIGQLREAFSYYKAIAGLFVTSAEKIGSPVHDEVEKLKTEGKTVAILHGEALYRRFLHLFASESGHAA